ncbi:sirohydrochlorin cobaltochelatase [Clostridium acetobutylicum]|uniref:CBIK protein (Chain A, anaerobic cobalt chelatase) n=1 Tax=Clostridium acetobutylicum (strain ATCC 824 / DSM 792 / JCM 1419 / IAM 19013 / LMG 5710 / NBRC 13948 / NRRL B-527 / VKM B-1787 / 2291 / W) TaxID=272562 RepID=Q97LH8_CLOAB|nr:sirohydrochlorin cobaltochelatase [Clostridium acetobutylicum]AAK78561.1 CBIK protein (chain A, anaerobic cobalt chelatase) [Clostridium acetobutylicum ATCC 824]ADZ19635.1 CBIK protein (chain A, anaerobic cobalt chelatase) [Clostridium acetobutylicum EA 2018]AEI31322.1 CBIK protein (chain A, anaerobic cobalt chelatase) [Clostridium acetobutylicum DSM 1731]PSM06088.1 sirohydrochlorin cobaltochelatase [Clostridium sp. NJ4]AWV80285.1 sirohydrochlorin cobaltochelatase [Clostridium acetobutylicu
MKKGILIVGFGTIYKDARACTIDKIKEEVCKQFPDYEVLQAFTSSKIIEKIKETEGIDFDTPQKALHKFKNKAYREVIIQPIYMIPGYEYEKLIGTVDKYLKDFERLKIGRPVLYFKGNNKNEPNDYEIFLEKIKDMIPKDKITVFMCHGTMHESNEYYLKLDSFIKKHGFTSVVIATLEGFPKVEDVIEYMEKNKFKEKYKGEVKIIPLLVTAGKHVKKDMQEEWVNIFKDKGYKVETYEHGLGEIYDFRSIYIQHIKDAIIRENYTAL